VSAVIITTRSVDFSARMTEMREWLNEHRFEPSIFTYEPHGNIFTIQVQQGCRSLGVQETFRCVRRARLRAHRRLRRGWEERGGSHSRYREDDRRRSEHAIIKFIGMWRYMDEMLRLAEQLSGLDIGIPVVREALAPAGAIAEQQGSETQFRVIPFLALTLPRYGPSVASPVSLA
jgi:hypothetical protein